MTSPIYKRVRPKAMQARFHSWAQDDAFGQMYKSVDYGCWTRVTTAARWRVSLWLSPYWTLRQALLWTAA